MSLFVRQRRARVGRLLSVAFGQRRAIDGGSPLPVGGNRGAGAATGGLVRRETVVRGAAQVRRLGPAPRHRPLVRLGGSPLGRRPRADESQGGSGGGGPQRVGVTER